MAFSLIDVLISRLCSGAMQRERVVEEIQTRGPKIHFESRVLVVWVVFRGHSGFARVSHPVFRDDGKSGATGTTVLFGTDDRTGGRGFVSRRCVAVAARADWTEKSARVADSGGQFGVVCAHAVSGV